LYEQTIQQSRKTNAPNALSQTKKAGRQGQKGRAEEGGVKNLRATLPSPGTAALKGGFLFWKARAAAFGSVIWPFQQNKLVHRACF
jgi:hypothetical protein